MDPAQAASLNFTPLLAECFRQASLRSSARTPEGTLDPKPAIQLVQLLDLAARRSAQLGLVTPGQDVVREIATPSLRSLFISSLQSLAQARVPTAMDHGARSERLKLAARAAMTFLRSLDQLRILAPGVRALVQTYLAAEEEGEQGEDHGKGKQATLPGGAGPGTDKLSQAAQNRQGKIARFQTERALRRSLDTFRDQADQSTKYAGRHTLRPSDVLLDAFFLTPRQRTQPTTNDFGQDSDQEDDEEPKSQGENGQSEEEEDEEEQEEGASANADGVPHNVRTYLLMLLNLHALQCASQLEAGQQELELLRSIPFHPPAPPRASTESEWRLDSGPGQTGPLLDAKGKPLRPFTLTGGRSAPSAGGAAPGVGNVAAGGTTDLGARQRLAKAVFQPSHRLPTMSVDDYLAEEMRRGNILTDGGPEQMARLTPREQRAETAEEDGTQRAHEASDEARREAIEWDEFKERHRKGEGNTMNRG